MEQELAEGFQRREEERRQWAEQASRADAEIAALRGGLEELERERAAAAAAAGQEGELESLREAELASREALGEEKVEVARLERELALTKEAYRVSRDASESDGAEIVRLQRELASAREEVVHAGRDASERETSEVDKLERELASLREEHRDAQRKAETLAEIWAPLRSLALQEAAEGVPLPDDLSLLLGAVQTIETQLARLKDERSEREEYCAELTRTMGTLQGNDVFSLFAEFKPFGFTQMFECASMIFRTT